jgi:putative membrane protein
MIHEPDCSVLAHILPPPAQRVAPRPAVRQAGNMGFLAHWIVTGISIVVAQRVVGGIHVFGLGALALAAFALGLINATVKPVLQLLSLPLTVLSLGFFYVVVNGVCFGLAAFVVPGFHVDSLGSAMLGSIIVSLVSWLLGSLFKRKDREQS